MISHNLSLNLSEKCGENVVKQIVKDNRYKSPLKLKGNPQACKFCGKVLASPSSYYVHLKLHSNEKPYACNLCEAAFSRKPYLDVHLRTHTGERPFQCGICTKRFTQKSSLNTHMRVHSGERPFVCAICHKGFALRSYLAAHQWSHVTDKQLSCPSCPLTFSSKGNYITHLKSHANPSHHSCHICGKAFMRTSFLQRHYTRVHRYPTENMDVAQTMNLGSLPSYATSVFSPVSLPRAERVVRPGRPSRNTELLGDANYLTDTSVDDSD